MGGLGYKMKQAIYKWNFKRAFMIGLVIIPVLIWDIFYGLCTLVFNGLTYIDEEGGKILEDLVE